MCHDATASTDAPLRASHGEAGHGSLANDVPFEFGQRAKQVEDELTARARGVDVLGQGTEADTLIAESADGGDQVGKRAAEPVELPDDKHIAFARDRQRLGKSGRSALAPDAFSSKMRLQPARLSASICNLVVWSSVETRA